MLNYSTYRYLGMQPKLSGHKNRQGITDEVLITDCIQAIKTMDIIQPANHRPAKELIKEYQEDLTYKFKVLGKDIQTRLAIIKEANRN